MKRFAFVLLSLLLVPVHAQEAPPEVDFGVRSWTNTEGRAIEAEAHSADDKIVRLKLAATGKIVNVPLAKLSQADRDYTKAWLVAKKDRWNVEVMSDEEHSSFKPTKAPGSSFAGTAIEPSEPENSLMLLLFKLTPPPDVPIGSFDPGRLVVKVDHESKLLTAKLKYVLPERAKDIDDYDAGERGILYEIPKRARLAEVKYNRPKLRPKQ